MSATAYTVERRSNLSYEEFQEKYVRGSRPVILTDVLPTWPAMGKWTPHYLAERYADRTFEIENEKWNFGDLMRAVDASTPEAPAPYLRNIVLREEFPELWNDIRPNTPFFHPNWTTRTWDHPHYHQLMNRCGSVEIFIGGNGRSFPVLHWDYYHLHVFLMQFYGRKEYYFYPPEQSEFLYPVAEQPNTSHCRDISRVDLEKYPLFAKAVPTVVTLEPGEILFGPSGWWHTVKMLSPSITLGLSVGNDTCWDGMVGDLTDKGSWLNKVRARFGLGKQRRRFLAEDEDAK